MSNVNNSGELKQLSECIFLRINPINISRGKA